MQGPLKKQYEEALVASGLVDDVSEFLALDPLPTRFSEGAFICQRGDAADRLWVITTGSVAVRDGSKTLYVRHRPAVVGEQNILSNQGFRWYDLVANESQVELLTIRKESIDHHPQAAILWRNIAKVISLKLKMATAQTADLLEQVEDDAEILRAYTNEYALSRRLRSGSRYLTDHRLENAVIWFSDIVNFSRFVLKLSPERTADLLQRFFNAQAEAIRQHEGYIDKFIGDGMMAFWVLPSEDPNSAAAVCQSALAAAEAAVQSVSRIRIGAQPLQLRVGLHIGPVLTGDFGSATRHQFTLIGAEVNKAARLEQLHGEDIASGCSKPGPIRMSAEFHAKIDPQAQKTYARKSSATLKDMGEVTLYT